MVHFHTCEWQDTFQERQSAALHAARKILDSLFLQVPLDIAGISKKLLESYRDHLPWESIWFYKQIVYVSNLVLELTLLPN